MTAHVNLEETYVALLRGINVGGKNVISMVELRNCFEREGFGEVATYIQSGNVIFRSTLSEDGSLTARIEEMLVGAFDYQAKVVLVSLPQMRAVVAEAPAGFGARPDMHRYDALFLMPPLTATAAMEVVLARTGVDEVWTGNGVLYFSRLIARASQSYLSRLASMSVYQSMTIRNWNTTTRLLRMMEQYGS